MPSLAFIVDVVNQRLVKSFGINLDGSLPPLTQGGTYDVSIRTVLPTNLTLPPFVDTDYTSYTFALGMGVLNTSPSAGTWLLADGSAPTVFTTPLPYNASAVQVGTALNLLAAIISAGGVAVSSPASAAAGGPWQVTWTTKGARDLLVVNPAGLDPVSGYVIDRAQTGDTDTQEIQTIYLLQTPAAYTDDFTALPDAAGTVSNLVVGSGAVNAVQRIVLDPLPYGGTFSVTCLGYQTTQISFGDNGVALQAALVALTSVGAGNVSVIQSGPCQWDVTFQGTLGLQAIAAMTVNAAGLLVPLGVTGSISLKVAGIDALVETKTSQITVQIDVTPPAGSRFTIVATQADLAASLFAPVSSPPSPLPSYSTTTEMNAAIAAAISGEDSLVLKKASNLSDVANAGTARTNLGLGTAATHAATDFDASGAATAAGAAAVASSVQKAQNGLDFSNLATTLQNLWKAATTAAGALLYMGAASTLHVLAPNTTGTLKVLSMTSSVPSWTVPSGGGGASPFTFQTANFNFAAGDKQAADTTGGTFTGTLPATPATTDLPIEVIDPQGTHGTDAFTLDPGGNNINGVAGTLNLNTPGARWLLVWVGGATGWRLI